MRHPTKRARRWAAATSTLVMIAVSAAVPVRAFAAPAVLPSRPDVVKSVSGHAAPPVATVKTDFPAPRPAAVTWPTAGAATVGVQRSTAARAGALPVWVQATTGAAPATVDVRVLERPAGAAARTDSLFLGLRRTDGSATKGPLRLTIDYSRFKDQYGGDWAARLRVVAQDGSPVTGLRNDLAASLLSADVAVGSSEATFAVAADAEGSTGSYRATSLAPSGSWQVSAQTGAFSWSYEMRTPPVPGGLQPTLTAAYNSNTVDGHTVSTNSQPSWLGEGWSMWPGFIERSYKSCGEDLGGNNATTKTGDLCWETDNATMSLDGHSGQLVLVDGTWNANGTWRLKDDDGTRIEHLIGAANGDDNSEYWKITTTDGTQYFLGRRADSTWTVPVFGNDADEPCNKSTFDASSCDQAYRWNLDHVVDRHGNSMSYFYREETNNYGVNLAKRTAAYTRGGTLERIEYGTREGESGQAPARVWFDVADRCLANCATHTATSWPDVPWDQQCLSGTCSTQIAPTFWSTQRLAKITTQVSTGNGNYRNVEQWTFTHAFPVPGDGTTASLWLSRIGHAGLAATTAATLPDVTFDGTMKQNRVNAAADGLPKLNKYRLTGIHNESGGAISVTYAEPDCADGAAAPPVDRNPKRCFPVRWALPPSPTVREDWFHRYVVAKVVADDTVGGNKDEVTTYEYAGDGAWAYDDNPLIEPAKRTWSQWRGYEKVVVRSGDPVNDLNKPESWTQFQYFRGMNGDRLAGGGTKTVTVTDSTGAAVADAEPLAGFLRETITRDGVGGTEVTGEIRTPWTRTTATRDGLTAYQVETSRVLSRTRLAAGTFRTTQIDTAYDHYGNATQVDDAGDLADAADNQCTTTAYAQDPATLLVNLPRTVTTVAVACGATPSYPSDAITVTHTYYDGGGLDSAPDKGDVTSTETVRGYSGSTPAYLQDSTATYDRYGRVLIAKDALGRPTTTAYTETNGLTTTTTTTNALNHVTTTTMDPAWGEPTRIVDPNQRVTRLDRDGLGRLVKAWLPGRSPDNGDSPHLRYTYQIRATAPSYLRTDTLKANGNAVATYTLYDGFLRERQTQAPSPAGGRILTDKIYDSRGLLAITRAAYYNADSPAGTSLFLPDAGAVPQAMVTVYDGAERPTDAIFLRLNSEKWRTRTYYGGDYTSVVPPIGSTATTTYVDARGHTTRLLQYRQRPQSGPPTGTADTTTYAYTKRGQLATTTDPAGNVWRYTYDVQGRQLTADSPDQGLTTMTYDDAGQLITATDARQKTVYARYDALGRKTETRLAAEDGHLLTRTVFDTLAKGSLTSSTRFVGDDAYTRTVGGYDAAGNPTGETISLPGVEGALAGAYPTELTYTVDGSVATKKLPALGADVPAETLVYGYDDLGLPDTVTGATTYITDTEYTALGEPTQLELGVTGKRLWQTTYREEGTRRVTEVLTEREQAGGVMVDDLSYAYDPTGNVTKIAERAAGSAADAQCFTYDYLRRVQAAWTPTDGCAATMPAAGLIGGPAPYWTQYAYDAVGNRTSMTAKGFAGTADRTSTYAYPTGGAGVDRPHAVTSIQTGSDVDSYGYDAAGNTISRPAPDGSAATQTLTWTDDGLLGSIQAGASADGRTSYVYDANGVQLLRRDPGKVTLFLGSDEITLDTATGGKTGTRQYDGVGSRTGSGLTWLVADQHGTSQTAIDSATLAPTQRRLDLFGNPRSTAGLTAGALTAGAGWPGGDRGFVGGTANEATGLTRLGAREYDPTLGKFISVDPVVDPADPQQMNSYAYANNNPTSMSDPDGRRYFVDAGGYIEAPSAKHMTSAAMKRVQKRIAMYKPMYDKWQRQLRATRAATRRAWQHDRDQQMADAQARGRARNQQRFTQAAGDLPLFYDITFDVGTPHDISQDTDKAGGYPQTLDPLYASPLDAMNELNRCFNCSFPIDNAPGHFPGTGEFIPLNACLTALCKGAPVRAYAINDGYYFIAQKGHFDAPGSVIRFQFQNGSDGRLQLRVTAWVQSSAVPDVVNKTIAQHNWQSFADNLAWNVMTNQCHGTSHC
ncbi:MAG: hypothetical protein HOV77_06575 [Hamadaea sp.]|uniref:RHS repeat-associated core domain-containing protein n=1 Tax=Hamadaea sp. TaxID=2024425 RepID=UPI0017D34D16|nr:RHS repeat-associated core domain-containing protein [Hamadaea sp.]NUT18831.1 hypothetical protein [Hamadaea sp.]